ncbi:MAG: ABC transporter ATP-binding protein [Armatimonadetes bacterium CG07_land_8_20_14_0_80_40_9]|nr:MAG: ABC transporter ATP-binding protein [Armatimonadetes bacterium CG07_land_8_20_14_0_80_40_9]
MITLKNLTKVIGNKKILDKINLGIQKGETIVIIGQSGCGKSTLLKNIIGLQRPTSGEIIIFDQKTTNLREEELNKVRIKMGMLFQEAALFDSMTVEENVAFPLRQHTRYKEEKIQGIVRERLKIMGMEGTERLMPAHLSGGMQRRVGLARALALEPEIVLYDEPTTGLDPIMKEVINNLILELKNRLKVTSIVVTHDMDTAFKVGDRIGMLHQGSLILIGTPEEIKASDNPTVQQFIKGL